MKGLGFHGQLRSWRARGVRTAADLSPANPTVTLIATVEAALDGGSLPVPGLFVRARIRGQEAHVHELPRRALGIDGRIMVVDPRRHLTSRKVVVRQTTEQQVLITSGLEDGELVVITPPPVVVEGMTVRLPDDPVAPAAAPSSAPGTSSMPTSPSATDSDQ